MASLVWSLEGHGASVSHDRIGATSIYETTTRLKCELAERAGTRGRNRWCLAPCGHICRGACVAGKAQAGLQNLPCGERYLGGAQQGRGVPMYIEFRIWRFRLQIALGMLEKPRPEPEQGENRAPAGFRPNDG